MTALTGALGCAGARVSGSRIQAASTARPELILTGDPNLSESDRLELTERLRAAFAFSLTLNGWSHPDEIAADPVEVRLAMGPGLGASTSGPNRFTVELGALRQPNSNGIFAHELTHLQDFRAARRGLRQLPRYLEEGRGYFVGREWRRQRNEPGGDGERAALLAKASAADVEFVLEKFRHQPEIREVGRARKGPLARAIGMFFLDYLRVRAGYPDALPRLSRTLERLSQGIPLEQAFSSQFDGVTLSAAEAKFVAFIRETEGNPAERLKGTPLEASLGKIDAPSGSEGVPPEDAESSSFAE